MLKIRKIPWYLSWKGLLGTKKPEAILIRTRFGIHTFGLSYPIDIVILDKRNIVKTIKTKLMPNRLFFWNPMYDKVIELPEGTVEKERIKARNKFKDYSFSVGGIL